MMDKVAYRIKQDGNVVVKCEGEGAELEVWHYAQQYRQDGELTIQHNTEGHWKRYALLCMWPVKRTPAQPEVGL